MKIEFRDKRLALITTDRAAETKLPIAAIKACREKLIVIDAAPDERTLRNWKSLRYEKLKGKREGQRSIRLNNQWRLVFLLDEERQPPVIVVLDIEDYH
jgi:proteic killer suppression protein